jgi:hypothetical protein
MYIFVFFLELFILFLLSNTVTRLLSIFFHRITHSKKATIYILAILFFPGTFIHEISHYFMANILFVPAFKIEFFPKLTGNNVKLGSVTIEKSDFFRRLLIGMAPFFFGTTILLGTIYLAIHYGLLNNHVVLILIGYLLFEIGNTMFSSKKDMEGAIELLVILFIIIGILFFFDIHLSFFNTHTLFTNPFLQRVFQKSTYYLLVPLGIDTIVIFLLKLLKLESPKYE